MLACYLCLLSVGMLPAAYPTPASGHLIAARTLSGDELVRIGEIHDVQNHYPEALTYYEQALLLFREMRERRGEADTLTTPDMGRQMHARIKGSELIVVPKSGHLVNLEQPDAFEAALEPFLFEHRGRADSGAAKPMRAAAAKMRPAARSAKPAAKAKRRR